MHYSPSEKDGVFVVEVARGADISYQSPRTSETFQDSQAVRVAGQKEGSQPATGNGVPNKCDSHGGNGGSANQCRTGLSQSDLSDSSSFSESNANYNYGGELFSADGPKFITKAEQLDQSTKPSHLPVCRQETIDLQPRLQSDIDLVNNVERSVGGSKELIGIDGLEKTQSVDIRNGCASSIDNVES